MWEYIEKINFTNIVSTMLIPLIIGWITFVIAKKQIRGTGVTQFRQQWINNLTEAISLFIAKAEVISILDLDDEDYTVHFKELSQTQHKIELMLNPKEKDHNELNEAIDIVRDLIHDEDLEDNELNEKMNEEIEKLLAVAKRVLKREWEVVKKGK